MANTETWVDDRAGPWQHIVLVFLRHIFIAGSRTRVGKWRTLRHCTATVTVLPPYFRSLAVYRKIAVQMQCRVAEARQFKCIETVSSEAKMFKHALGGLPNMKFLPVRSTTDFFL